MASLEPPHNRFGRRQRGDKRHFVNDGGPADGVFIRPWALPQGRVDDHVYLAVFDVIGHIGTALPYFHDGFHRQAALGNILRCSPGGHQLITELYQPFGDGKGPGFIIVVNA